MSEQLYLYSAPEIISCDSCRNLAAGDQVDISLRTDLLPALPVSVRGLVQLVSDLVYTIQYETDDLLGAIALLSDEFVDNVVCVSELTLAQEYSDARDDGQDDRMTNIEGSLAALGVVPSDGDARFVVHPDSTPGVSVESIRHDKITVPANIGVETVVLEPTALASPLAVLDLTGLSYRLEVAVSAISEKVLDNRDSAAEFLLVGTFNQGASYQTISLLEKDGVTITGVKVGNTLHITATNPSSGALQMFVTSKFRILS
jgi:hypothetical protein